MEVGDVLRELFDEKTIDVLSLFHSSPDETFYLREISEKTGVSAATTYRIIQRLLETEVITKTEVKTAKLYTLRDTGVNRELKGLFEEEPDPLDLFVDYACECAGVKKILLHEKSDDTNNVLVVGENLDSEQINDKATEIRKKHDFGLVVLTLSKQQFRQMSDMGLFPGNKELLWER